MIIDDDEAVGNLEQEVLERAGYAVQMAFSGTEAKETDASLMIMPDGEHWFRMEK